MGVDIGLTPGLAVDNNQDGVAEYVLQTKYTVAIMAANGTSLDVSGVQLVDSKVRDNINSVPSATTPFFSTGCTQRCEWHWR